MARKDDFHKVVPHCVMCGNEIPPERPRMAITCSDECRNARKNYRRSRQDQRACRYCLHPSTPEQRLDYQRWRRKPQSPEEEEQFRLWRQSQITEERNKSRAENKRLKAEAEVGGEAEAEEQEQAAMEPETEGVRE